MKTDYKTLWSKYKEGTDYKHVQDLYNTTKTNEKFYAGDQWDKGVAKSLLKETYNFIEQLTDMKVSTVKSSEMTIKRSADDNDEEGSFAEEAANTLTLVDKQNWERLKMEDKNEDTLLTAALTGLGGTYWFWDNDIKTGNDFQTKGNFDCDIIDAIDVYVSNPCEINIQLQDTVQIPFKKTMKQVKAMAKKFGVSDEDIKLIVADEEQETNGYDKQINRQNEKDIVTVLLSMWKEKGNVWFSYSTNSITLKKKTNTELTRYPIAFMNWKKRKKYIYGTAEMTYIINNQKSANTLASIRSLSAKLTSLPKIVYNKNMIQGVTSQAGGVYGVDIQPGTDIGGALQYKQPTSSSIDIDKSMQSSISLTKELKGINDNVTGASRPENRGALLLQQKAAGVPIESIRRRYKQYIEDVALIWLDFYVNKYKLNRKIKDENGEVIDYTGTNFKDLMLNTKIDVGESTQFSEAISIDLLDNWKERQEITFVEYLKRIPQNLVPDTQGLIDIREEQKEQPAEQSVDQFLAQLPPEVQQVLLNQPNAEQLVQELMQLPPEQQQAAIQQLI